MKPVNFYSAKGKFLLTQLFLWLNFASIFAAQKQSFPLSDTIATTDSIQPVGDAKPFNKKTFWWITGGHALAYGGSLAVLGTVWYDDFDRTKLHAFNDMDEWGGMDKLGHVATAWHLSNFSYSLYRYTGMKQKKAALVGASVAMLYQTTLEFFDGYSAKWGFSFGDMGANLAGSALSYFRNMGVLRNFHLKYSWWQTKYPPYRPNVLGTDVPQQMLKDYNGQTYWASINFPKAWMKKSNWLCFSLGYSIDGFTGGKQNYFDASVINPPSFNRVGEFYFSLDLDVEKLNIKKKWLKTVLKVMNVIKVPCPAIGINTGGKFLFKPFGY